MTEPWLTVALLAWGTWTALDLVAVGQVMVSRPLVAGTVAGWMLGDPAAGALAGGLLELYALETLAVGAVRYPDYGPAAVGAAAVLAHAPAELALGLAGALGLAVAWLGDWSIVWHRRSVTRTVRARARELAAGDAVILQRIHVGAVGRDALRGILLTATALVGAWALHQAPSLDGRAALAVTVAVVGAGLGTAIQAAVRLSGAGRRLGWLVLGVAGGVLVVLT